MSDTSVTLNDISRYVRVAQDTHDFSTTPHAMRETL